MWFPIVRAGTYESGRPVKNCSTLFDPDMLEKVSHSQIEEQVATVLHQGSYETGSDTDSDRATEPDLRKLGKARFRIWIRDRSGRGVVLRHGDCTLYGDGKGVEVAQSGMELENGGCERLLLYFVCTWRLLCDIIWS